MNSAIFALVVNTTVALLFAASFAVMAATTPSFRRLYWLALAYGIGALTPASELLVRLSGYPAPFVFTSYVSFVTAFYVTAAALCRLYRLPVPWLLFGVLLVISIAVRATIWGGTRDDLAYELAYQTPFAVAVGICAWTIRRAFPRGRLDFVLCGLFVVSALHFMVKPFLAAHFGSGPRATDYVASMYALISQSATGILLTSIGLALLMICVRKMLADANRIAEYDALSALLNRRGFSKSASVLLTRAQKDGSKVALSIIDLDHFKRLNDTYGHQTGDWLIAAVAEIFRICAGPDAVLARLGGEEFVHLEAIGAGRTGREFGEAVRQHLVHLAHDDHPELRVTVSVGVAIDDPDTGLSDLLSRADRALYAAKGAGRDRVTLERPVLVGSSPRVSGEPA